ncbi:MAG: FkbM family methyltransferase [Thermoanaerobaculia bacterium]|nr:FkbM family methyltransferase [Thermoanaerobaculia bacterium]
MKPSLKKLLTAVAARLPPGAQVALVDGVLSSAGAWRTLAQASKACGLKGVEVEGELGRIVGDASDEAILRIYARTGRWARRTVDTIVPFFREEEGRFVDVGANIGLTTVPVAARTRARCVAIEPEPSNFEHLVTNVRARCPGGRVECHRLAVMDRPGSVDLALSPDNMGDHRVRLPGAPRGSLGEERWETTAVECRPLDEIVEPGDERLAVKIDVQGAEPFVFTGGTRTLSRTGLLVMEWSPYWMRTMNADPRVVTEFLAASYRQVAIAEGEEGEPRPADAPAEGARVLLELFERHAETYGPYFDVVARK